MHPFTRIYPGAKLRIRSSYPEVEEDPLLSCRLTPPTCDLAFLNLTDTVITVSAFAYNSTVTGITVLDELRQDYDIVYIDGKLTHESTDEVITLDPSHPLLSHAFRHLPAYHLWMYTNFMRNDRLGLQPITPIEFQATMLSQQHLYAGMFLEPKLMSEHLITQIRSYFVPSLPHDNHCWEFQETPVLKFSDRIWPHYRHIDPPASSSGDHVCSPDLHLHYLFHLLHRSARFIRLTQNGCLGGMHPIPDGLLYLHISPAGLMMVGINRRGKMISEIGQGTSTHPVIRALFWRALLQHRPDLRSIFESKYLEILNLDCLHRRFLSVPAPNIETLVRIFDTKVCLECSILPSSLGQTSSVARSLPSSRVRSFDPIVIHRPVCSHGNMYSYALVLLSIFKHGIYREDDGGFTCLEYQGESMEVILTSTDLKWNNRSLDPILRSGFVNCVLPLIRK